MNSSLKLSIQRRPDAEFDIAELAQRLLNRAGAIGLLPTPVDELITAAGVENVEETESFKNQFLASIPRTARSVFDAAWYKIRGIADLRDKAIYVATATAA